MNMEDFEKTKIFLGLEVLKTKYNLKIKYFLAILHLITIYILSMTDKRVFSAHDL